MMRGNRTINGLHKTIDKIRARLEESSQTEGLVIAEHLENLQAMQRDQEFDAKEFSSLTCMSLAQIIDFAEETQEAIAPRIALERKARRRAMELVRTIARFTRNGERISTENNRRFVQSVEDAFDTIDSLITQARSIERAMGGNPDGRKPRCRDLIPDT
jgi:hypothetical protein